MDAKKIGFALALIMPLVLASLFAMPVIAPTTETASATASVTVNKFVDITLTTGTVAGLNFGSKDPGTTRNPELEQNSTAPAATVTRETTSNTNVETRLQGANFLSGANSFAVSNLVYDDDATVDQGTETNLPQFPMSTSYNATAYTSLTGASPTLNLWFWLSIPSGQAQGTYSSTIDVQGS